MDPTQQSTRGRQPQPDKIDAVIREGVGLSVAYNKNLPKQTLTSDEYAYAVRELEGEILEFCDEHLDTSVRCLERQILFFQDDRLIAFVLGAGSPASSPDVIIRFRSRLSEEVQRAIDDFRDDGGKVHFTAAITLYNDTVSRSVKAQNPFAG